MYMKSTMMTCVSVCVAAHLLSSAAASDHQPPLISYPGDVGAASGAFPQTSTFISKSGIPAWRLLQGGKARMQNFPKHFTEIASQITTPDNFHLPAGAEVKYGCPAGSGPCEVAVFVYECAPCKAKKGKLLQYLVVNGYWRTRCAPTFTTGVVGGIQHRMSAYVKILAEGEEEIIKVPDDVEFAAFALSNGGKPACHSLDTMGATEATCEDETFDRCVWNGGESPRCKLAKCVNRGPGGGCDIDTCVHAELGNGEAK